MYILLLLGVFVLWRLQAYLFRRYWDKDLSVTLAFADTHVYEGDRSILKEVVVNDKRMPIPAVHIRLIVPRNLIFEGEAKANSTISDQNYKRDIFSFLGRQQITRSLPFTATRRGYYELTSVDMVGSDYFFHEGNYRSLPQKTGLYVFPRQISTSQVQLICKEISGTVLAQNRLHPDPFEFSGIRDYEKTDPMNHVNWKASARMGSLMVNQYDSTTNINVTVLLDVEDSHILRHEPLVEEGIRIVSSLAGRMVRQKMPLTVKCNGMRHGQEEPISLYLPAGGSRMMDLNQELACIDSDRLAYSGEVLLQRTVEEKASGLTFILISQNTTREMKAQAARLAANDNQILWLLPFFRDEEPEEFTLPGVRVLRWEVGA